MSNYGKVTARVQTHTEHAGVPVPAHGTINFTPQWRVINDTVYAPLKLTGYLVDGVLMDARTGGEEGVSLLEGEYIVEGSFTAVSGTRLKAFTSVSVKAGETVSLSGWLTDQVGKQPSMYGIPATEAISIDPNLDERVRKIVQEVGITGGVGEPGPRGERGKNGLDGSNYDDSGIIRRLTALENVQVPAAQPKSARSVNVLDAPYRADPTGAQDSTKAIQDAVDAVAALGGGAVFIPGGIYKVSYPFIQLKGFVQVYGEGTATQIVATTDKTIVKKTGVFHTGTYEERLQDPTCLRFGVSNLMIRSRKSGIQHQQWIPNLCGICFNTDLGKDPADPDAVPTLNFLEIWGMETGAAIIGIDDQAMKVFSLKTRHCGQSGLLVGKPVGHPEGTGGAADNKFFGADIGGSNQSKSGYAGIEVWTSQTKFSLSTSWYTHRAAPFADLYALPTGSTAGQDVAAGAPSTANRRNQKDGAGWYIRATKCAFVECEAQENGGHGFIVAYGDNVLSECRAESSSYKGTVTAPAKINEASDFYVLNEGTDGTVLNACTSRSARKADGGARWSYYVETWFKGLAIVNCVSRDVATPSGWTGVPVRTRSPQGDDVFIQVNNYLSTTRPGSKTWNLTHATTKTTSNGAERCYVQVDNLTGFGLIHMDFTYRGNFANDEKLFTWPADAPAPAGLIETQLIPGQAGQIYATVGDRSVKSWDIPLQEGRHVIVNLMGFFTKS